MNEDDEETIETSIVSVQNTLSKKFEQKTKSVMEAFEKYQSLLEKATQNNAMFNVKVDYSFTKELKHEGVTVVSPKIVKSIGTL